MSRWMEERGIKPAPKRIRGPKKVKKPRLPPPPVRPVVTGTALPAWEFQVFLSSLGYATYQHYLLSRLWRTIRERVLEAASRKCARCRREATEVHHYAYTRENLRGESLEGLEASCKRCHREEHPDKKKES